MKNASAAMVVTMLGFNIWGAGNSAAKAPLTVCVGGTKDIDLENRAETVADGVFANIGVRVYWRRLDNCPQQAIQVNLSLQGSTRHRQQSLAYAVPSEGTHIVVFVNRVRNRVDPHALPFVLGHVIAHEVTHILQGVARHSETGVMKAEWNAEDFRQMTLGPLAFTQEDVLLINRGLEARSALSVTGQ